MKTSAVLAGGLLAAAWLVWPLPSVRAADDGGAFTTGVSTDNPTAQTQCDALQADLQAALDSLQKATAANKGGNVGKGIADLQATITAVGQCRVYLQTHPELNRLPAVTSAKMAEVDKLIHAAPPSRSSSAPRLRAALDSLKAAFGVLQNTPGGDLGGNRDPVATGIGRAATDIIAGITFVPAVGAPDGGDPFRPATTTGRLVGAKSDLQNALVALRAVPAAPHGGLVEKAEAALNLALGETEQGLVWVAADPVRDPLNDGHIKFTPPGWPPPLTPGYARYATDMTRGRPGSFIFMPRPLDPNVSVDLVRAFFHVHNAYFNFLPSHPEGYLPQVGDIGGHRDRIMEQAIVAMNQIVLALDYVHSHPPMPDTAEGRLQAVQAAAQQVKDDLANESSTEHGGHLEAAQTALSQTLADVAEALVLVRSSADFNRLETTTQPAAGPVTVHGSGIYESASGTIAGYYANRFPVMLAAQETLDRAIAMLSNVALTPYTGPAVGDLHGLRYRILSDLRQAAREVVDGANFAAQAANAARRSLAPPRRGTGLGTGLPGGAD